MQRNGNALYDEGGLGGFGVIIGKQRNVGEYWDRRVKMCLYLCNRKG